MLVLFAEAVFCLLGISIYSSEDQKRHLRQLLNNELQKLKITFIVASYSHQHFLLSLRDFLLGTLFLFKMKDILQMLASFPGPAQLSVAY